jgi:lipoprotein-anchoring transpeptidase ErfK/SrfK
MPNAWEEYIKRNSLTMTGTIVSNGREGTKWTSNGVYVSGFETRINSYDRDLVSDPPPLTPEVSDTYEFIEWREVN